MFNLERCCEFEKGNLEVIYSKIRLRENEKYMLIVGYIPPYQKDLMKDCVNVINEVGSQCRNVITAGDVNVKSASWGIAENNRVGEFLDQCLDENENMPK